MIIILKQDITNTQKDKIKSVLKENGLSGERKIPFWGLWA